MNNEGWVHIEPARALAIAMLFAAGGPMAVWLGLRVRIPEPDPGAASSVAALVVSPETWSEAFVTDNFRSRPL
jgi:hypothetical protein